jgi:Calcineurin-like phosphoesterase
VPSKRYAVVLSDVHIGNGAPTCWYQPAVHEPQLSAALRWILASRDTIKEVVLLGDLFDVWTYPPGVRPPTLREIIAANPVLLGPRGPLAELVRALPGEVRLLLGNHDGSLSRADVDGLNAALGGNVARGERIELVDAPMRVVTGSSGARTVFAHGHYQCMFNAPDARSRWGTIPIGHFVSRAIAYQLARTLTRGRTAADRGNSGNPSGISLGGLWAGWNRRDDLAAFLLEYIERVTGMPRTTPIVMPVGPVATAQEAARVFDGLYTMWRTRLGRWEDAFRAANADHGGGDDLAWFGQRLAMETGSDLTVMGHTHSAIAGLEVSPVDYVNNGYACVSRPDAPTTPTTFTQVDLERATAQVLSVVPTPIGFGVLPARVRRLRSAIVHGRDYSCYARIENRTGRPLIRTSVGRDSASYWVVPPPMVIPPGARLDAWLQDTPLSPRGSEGRFSYSDGTRTYDFFITCPTVRDNAVTSPVPYETKVGTNPWRSGRVDHSGYPVQARFRVGAARPAPWRPRLPAPPARVPVPVP